jgi:hypothetical protein
MVKRDYIVAGLLGLLGASCLLKPIRNPIIATFWNPVGVSTLVILLAALIFLRMDLAALVLVAIYLYLYNNSHIRNTEERRVEVERGIDEERFNPRTSIDIQFADGTAVHDRPSMLGWTKDASPLLVYPPSEATLKSMSG